MALDPQKQSRLMAFTNAAKQVIFNADRMGQLMPMMDTRDGAIQAVQTVMAIIEKSKPVPRDIGALLAVNIYMLMVEMAQEILRQKPDPKVVIKVIQELLKTVTSGAKAAPKPVPPPTAPAPQGMIQQAMPQGVAA